mgnify:CR=1 FL=1
MAGVGARARRGHDGSGPRRRRDSRCSLSSPARRCRPQRPAASLALNVQIPSQQVDQWRGGAASGRPAPARKMPNARDIESQATIAAWRKCSHSPSLFEPRRSATRAPAPGNEGVCATGLSLAKPTPAKVALPLPRGQKGKKNAIIFLFICFASTTRPMGPWKP